MKYLNFAKQFAVVALSAAVFSSCDKPDEVEPLGDRGQTLVKLIGGGSPTVRLFSVDFKPSPQSLVAADLRRDIPNETELNRTMNVVIKDDTAAVTAYDNTLLQLPASAYTIGSATPKTGGQGGTYNITLAPGEFARQIVITIPDATVLSTSANYGLAFTITSADADGKISTQKTIIYKIGAKNPYDGVYQLTGFFTHPTTPGYTGPYGTATTGGPLECEWITIGPTTVKREIGLPAPYEENYLFWNNTTPPGGLGFFSNVGYRVDVNPATNAITLLPAPLNAVTLTTTSGAFSPSTHNIDFSGAYNATRTFTEHYEYLRAR